MPRAQRSSKKALTAQEVDELRKERKLARQGIPQSTQRSNVRLPLSRGNSKAPTRASQTNQLGDKDAKDLRLSTETRNIKLYFSVSTQPRTMKFENFLLRNHVRPDMSEKRVRTTIGTKTFKSFLTSYLRDPATKDDDFQKFVEFVRSYDLQNDTVRPNCTYADLISLIAVRRNFTIPQEFESNDKEDSPPRTVPEEENAQQGGDQDAQSHDNNADQGKPANEGQSEQSGDDQTRQDDDDLNHPTNDDGGDSQGHTQHDKQSNQDDDQDDTNTPDQQEKIVVIDGYTFSIPVGTELQFEQQIDECLKDYLHKEGSKGPDYSGIRMKFPKLSDDDLEWLTELIKDRYDANKQSLNPNSIYFTEPGWSSELNRFAQLGHPYDNQTLINTYTANAKYLHDLLEMRDNLTLKDRWTRTDIVSQAKSYAARIVDFESEFKRRNLTMPYVQYN